VFLGRLLLARGEVSNWWRILLEIVSMGYRREKSLPGSRDGRIEREITKIEKFVGSTVAGPEKELFLKREFRCMIYTQQQRIRGGY